MINEPISETLLYENLTGWESAISRAPPSIQDVPLVSYLQVIFQSYRSYLLLGDSRKIKRI